MNKTALQQAIEIVIAECPKEIKTSYDDAYCAGLERAAHILSTLIPTTERQQLEDAWNDGYAAGNNECLQEEYSMPGQINEYRTFSDYYTTTYKTT